MLWPVFTQLSGFMFHSEAFLPARPHASVAPLLLFVTLMPTGLLLMLQLDIHVSAYSGILKHTSTRSLHEFQGYQTN